MAVSAAHSQHQPGVYAPHAVLPGPVAVHGAHHDHRPRVHGVDAVQMACAVAVNSQRAVPAPMFSYSTPQLSMKQPHQPQTATVYAPHALFVLGYNISRCHHRRLQIGNARQPPHAQERSFSGKHLRPPLTACALLRQPALHDSTRLKLLC